MNSPFCFPTHHELLIYIFLTLSIVIKIIFSIGISFKDDISGVMIFGKRHIINLLEENFFRGLDQAQAWQKVF